MDYTKKSEIATQGMALRKMSSVHRDKTWMLCVPRSFVSALNIHKGDYVKCTIVENELHVRKVEV